MSKLTITHPVVGKVEVEDLLKDSIRGSVPYPMGMIRVLCEELLHAHAHMSNLETQIVDLENSIVEFEMQIENA